MSDKRVGLPIAKLERGEPRWTEPMAPADCVTSDSEMRQQKISMTTGRITSGLVRTRTICVSCNANPQSWAANRARGQRSHRGGSAGTRTANWFCPRNAPNAMHARFERARKPRGRTLRARLRECRWHLGVKGSQVQILSARPKTPQVSGYLRSY
jgi:hypothetical protein